MSRLDRNPAFECQKNFGNLIPIPAQAPAPYTGRLDFEVFKILNSG